MKIKNYEIIDHGADHMQYFPGVCAAFTPYDDCVTGWGVTPQEALEDALEQLACLGVDTEGIGEKLSEESDIPCEDGEPHPEWGHYVSILYTIA